MEAARQAMDEVASPIMAISLVLMAVFIPCAFISGITGQFFKQFAVTIAVSTFFSALNSLTLSPAPCAHCSQAESAANRPAHEGDQLRARLVLPALQPRVSTAARRLREESSVSSCGSSSSSLVVYGGLLFLTYKGFTTVPTGFIPTQDKGYLVVNVQLPDAASLERTAAVMAECEKIARGDPKNPEKYPGIPGVLHTITIPGTSVVQNANGSNFGTMFIVLDEFHNRHDQDKHGAAIMMKLRAECSARIGKRIGAVFPPPPVDGLGNAGGFKVMVRDQRRQGLARLQAATDTVVEDGNQTARARRPVHAVPVEHAADVRRCGPHQVHVDGRAHSTTCSSRFKLYLGGYYTNDFNRVRPDVAGEPPG